VTPSEEHLRIHLRINKERLALSPSCGGRSVGISRYHVPVEDETPGARRLIDSERRVHRILRARFTDALAEMGVSFAQLEVMELLHGVEKTHPGAIGRHLFITRQSAGHLVRQLERGSLVETWQSSGGSIAVRLLDTGRKRIRYCHLALEPIFACLDALEPGTRTRLERDLRACEDLLRPRPRPWWLEPS
jgi:DNA-binding MarR family transcriptional regulator